MWTQNIFENCFCFYSHAIKVSYYLIRFVVSYFLLFIISILLSKVQLSSQKIIAGTNTMINIIPIVVIYLLNKYKTNLFICDITFKTVSEFIISLEIRKWLCKCHAVNKLEFLNILINHSSFLQTRKVIAYHKIRV